MSGHSNQKIQQHVEDSKTLVDKMQKLTDTLQDALHASFAKNMGVPLPSAIDALVRETDIAMVFSTDPAVDEYINGARKLIGASLTGEKMEIVNGMLDLVDVVARKIIGTGDIKTGIHSTAARTGPYITAAFSAVQKASAQDWATSADFFVSYYAFVVFRAPASPQDALSRGAMLRGAIGEGDAEDTRAMAMRNYTHEPL